jgi:HEAT repeat protein
MGHLWEALSDSDPFVRAMAVETVDPQGQGIALLEEAASDSDQIVRSTAKFRLEHVSSEE